MHECRGACGIEGGGCGVVRVPMLVRIGGAEYIPLFLNKVMQRGKDFDEETPTCRELFGVSPVLFRVGHQSV